MDFDPDADTDIHAPLDYANQSTYSYDGLGRMLSVQIDDGQDRTIKLVNDINGQVLQRAEYMGFSYETGELRALELHYRFGGIGVGDVGNNGTSNIDYAASITEHLKKPPTTQGPFFNGSNTPVGNYDFDQSYDAINGLTYESTASRYTVVEGDTLEIIASKVWGDASYWYLIADANGLLPGDTLIAGRDLTIPNKVHNSHNTSDVYRVYDPNQAIGDTSPTRPKMPKHHTTSSLLLPNFRQFVHDNDP